MSHQIGPREVAINHVGRMPWLAGFVLLFVPGSVLATHPQTSAEPPEAFHWVHQASEPKLWEEILQKFNEELTPEQATAEKSAINTYGYNYLKMAGDFRPSALLQYGRRPAQEASKHNPWMVV